MDESRNGEHAPPPETAGEQEGAGEGGAEGGGGGGEGTMVRSGREWVFYPPRHGDEPLDEWTRRIILGAVWRTSVLTAHVFDCRLANLHETRTAAIQNILQSRLPSREMENAVRGVVRRWMENLRGIVEGAGFFASMHTIHRVMHGLQRVRAQMDPASDSAAVVRACEQFVCGEREYETNKALEQDDVTPFDVMRATISTMVMRHQWKSLTYEMSHIAQAFFHLPDSAELTAELHDIFPQMDYGFLWHSYNCAMTGNWPGDRLGLLRCFSRSVCDVSDALSNLDQFIRDSLSAAMASEPPAQPPGQPANGHRAGDDYDYDYDSLIQEAPVPEIQRKRTHASMRAADRLSGPSMPRQQPSPTYSPAYSPARSPALSPALSPAPTPAALPLAVPPSPPAAQRPHLLQKMAAAEDEAFDYNEDGDRADDDDDDDGSRRGRRGSRQR